MAKFEGQEQMQVFLWTKARLPGYEVLQNHQFLQPHRAFELDISIPRFKLGIEVDGIGGSHMMIKGWIRDREKDLVAVIHGWLVLRVTTPQVRDGTAYDLLDQVIKKYEAEESAVFGVLDNLVRKE